jgi:ubiquinone/menaquinone biosynthesis C-methylase UbiE
MVDTWNHNTHYHDLVLRSMPSPCQRALDVGCGTGMLSRRLAEHCGEVIAIDIDGDAISRAGVNTDENPRIGLIHGDAMKHPFPRESFDFITAVASLHHLPLKPALSRFKDLLSPGGVLIVIGLYRIHTFQDYVWSAIALPQSVILGSIRGRADVAAPIQEPRQTITEIQQVCSSLLPGSVIRRRLLYRYSLTWRKPR